MKLRLCILLGFFMLLFAGKVTAQENNAASKFEYRINKKGYYYSFTGAQSREEIENLQYEILALKNVTEFKGEYKAENGMGQIIVMVIEKIRTSEGESFFEPSELKKILERRGYKPYELTIEEFPAE